MLLLSSPIYATVQIFFNFSNRDRIVITGKVQRWEIKPDEVFNNLHAYFQYKFSVQILALKFDQNLSHLKCGTSYDIKTKVLRNSVLFRPFL